MKPKGPFEIHPASECSRKRIDRRLKMKICTASISTKACKLQEPVKNRLLRVKSSPFENRPAHNWRPRDNGPRLHSDRAVQKLKERGQVQSAWRHCTVCRVYSRCTLAQKRLYVCNNIDDPVRGPWCFEKTGT